MKKKVWLLGKTALGSLTKSFIHMSRVKVVDMVDLRTMLSYICLLM